ncbi:MULTISPECIES: hypothetical protein [Rummeliibacillus]|uniref:hypothetical protein n=1 Tax=Rummeliibacillus TaxID=648802 RepID=UPI0011B634B4|nr:MULTISPECIES: hypothetical protein [Rummeliibacillus]
MSFKKILTFGLSIAVLGASVSAEATTYISKSLSGTNAESGYKVLGNGTRYLKGTGTYGTGNAYAMRIIPYFPDEAVANFSIKKGATGKTSFHANATNSSGNNQSYYIRWYGNSSNSSANLKITD